MTVLDEARIGAIFRAEIGRCVATLIRVLGDIDAAEDAVQDAFTIALDRWPATGLPDNPGAWIVTTARNRAIDRVRRAARGAELQVEATLRTQDDEPPREVGPVEDDQLRLLFTCCHPALSSEARVALTLRLLGGLTTAQVASAFLVGEATMAQRLVRAKRKIRDAAIPYRMPGPEDLPGRLQAVLTVVYLVHTTGVDQPPGSDGDELVEEARRLARLLVTLLPEEPEPVGLLALLLLSAARRHARFGPDGGVVLFADQDRERWDPNLLTEGHELVRTCLTRGRPGPFQVQAAIQAVHTTGSSADETDWGNVLELYDLLQAMQPSPVVALNRAVAVAEVHGTAIALELVEGLATALAGYAPFHAVHAELLGRAGRRAEAAAAFRAGAAATDDPAVVAHLTRRAAEHDAP